MSDYEELKKIVIENPEIAETLLTLALSLSDSARSPGRESEQ